MPASSPPLAFQRRQLAFAAHLRDPDGNPAPPDIEPRRLAIYTRLVYNNVEGFLARTFAVCRSVVPKPAWHGAVRAFLREHRASSPYFAHIPAEFLAFLEAASAVRDVLPAFALELCHYEWTKAALDLAADADCRFDDDEVAEADAVRLSPLARLLEYTFAVHAIDAEHRPTAPPSAPTLLVAWRDRGDRVRCTRVNAATMQLLQSIQPGRNAGACLADLAGRLETRQAEQMRKAGLAMLTRLHCHDIVLRPAAAAAPGPLATSPESPR